MKKGSTFFLKVVLLLIATGVAAGLLWFPPHEGAAQGKDLVSIYFNPVIIYAYVGSLPFFVGIYQAIKLLNLIDANRAFSQAAINTLRTMKQTSLALIGFIVLGLFYIRFFANGDDPAGPTMLGMIVCFGVVVIATGAAVFQKLLQNALDLKSENDLTV